MRKTSIIYVIVLLLTIGRTGSLSGQTPSNVSLKFLGLTIHPQGDPTAELQPFKLDRNAVFVMNFGGALGYERFIWRDRISVKALQALFADCSAGLASVTHVAIRGTVLKKKAHRLSLGIGPALLIREDWDRLPNYSPSGYMNSGNLKPFGPVQWKIFWYGVEIEYDVRLGEHLDFSASMTPGLPMAITIGGGLKYWFNRDYKVKLRLPKIKEDRIKQDPE